MAGDPQLKPRARFAKGSRPSFLKDPDVDRLLAVVTALTAELSVVRERLDTVERLAEQGLPATPANIEAYRLDPDVEQAREATRAGMLERVFRILAQPMDDDDAGKDYEALIEKFS